MAEVTQHQVVDYVKNISVLELSQLVKRARIRARRVGCGSDADGNGARRRRRWRCGRAC